MTRDLASGHRAELGVAGQFSLVELDLLATYAQTKIPYPVQVPSFGKFPGERELLLGIAGDTLRLRGLADEDGPTDLGDDLVTALVDRRGTIDLVLGGTGRPEGFVAIIGGDSAMVLRQTLDGPGTELVDVWQVAVDDLAQTMAGLIGSLTGARIMPLRVPMAAVRALYELRARGNGGLGNELYEITGRYGCSVDDLDALVRAGDAVTGGGQLGATVVSEQRKDVRAGTELSWLDSPGGRLRVAVEQYGGVPWMSVNPLHPRELHAAIADLVTLVRRHCRR